jgi:glutamyl-tRNA synthetase
MVKKEKEISELVLKYALQNAVRYEGKANAGAVIGKILQEKPSLKSEIKNFMKEIQETIKKVNRMKKEKQEEELGKFHFKKEKQEKKEVLPELPEAKKGKIVLRLAPFPSGPLHIGNARPAIINDYYAKRYNGKFLLVMDDTIGSKEKSISKDAYVLIPEGLEYIGIKPEETYYKSDRLKIYYEYAEKLIGLNKAYVCSCSQKDLKKNRKNQQECKCRKKTPAQNLKDWKNMFNSEPGSMTLRIKTGLSNSNPAFRDRVIFRISDQQHPRVKAKVWPLLDFSWAVDDHLLNITHIIRGKDLMIESDMEKYIWDIFEWKHPVILHTGLVQLEGVKISKSKSKKEVESGE